MEYQSFFMLLKSYVFENNLFCSNNPFMPQGFVQIKKEQQNYSVVIQLNNFLQNTYAYVVCKQNLAKVSIQSITTKASIDFELICDATYVFITDYSLFACKNGTLGCQEAYSQILKNKNQLKNKNILEKIFGKVYDTYFFDCIKPKLANMFAVGKEFTQLNDLFAFSKWTIFNDKGVDKVVGIIYKDNFAYAIAIGGEHETNRLGKSYTVNGKTYNICFLSASNGKIIDI